MGRRLKVNEQTLRAPTHSSSNTQTNMSTVIPQSLPFHSNWSTSQCKQATDTPKIKLNHVYRQSASAGCSVLHAAAVHCLLTLLSMSALGLGGVSGASAEVTNATGMLN